MPKRADSLLTRLVLGAPPGIVEAPHPLLLGLLVLLSGGALLLAGGRTAPESLERTLPVWLVLTWGVFLVTGGGLAIMGLLSRGLLSRTAAMGLERAGNNLLAPAAIVYGAALLQQAGSQAILAAGLAIAFGLASALYAYTRQPGLWERLLARQIARELRQDP